ncbi:hypothetical protein A3C23_02325 [Candidatus Roizmanbacteria bacterium RIFCSPHIGHO2_02_FULL_37_13b]|uniref:Uncharacterized protein n=1 Tax=Candidatus Roizmanbacteria bacterium RIFCSPLOWO2_02_FULL_36_11 TaxID=1802071 RepID=A0A1F7JJ27_9BACT|nr:MAG: hypothetical protein A3C23_02325 [Candidatus Roizmanbacteria bacterium RIFCSPHIGHO2_02_FULL_37_13b]OGK55599.1 MAG: hypothetical protein A3H78_01450 [Candidatus Roizmanbacteria bacterium RIFCSPLOWO2_02_FULL_36_11]
MKKIRLRKVEPIDTKIISIKVLFLVILLCLGLVVSRFVKKPQSQNKDPQNNSSSIKDIKNPLGDVKGLMSQFNADSLKKKSEDLADYLVTETTDQIEKTASVAGNTAQAIIYDAALKPFVDQFNKLPDGQKELLKKQLCR